MKLSNVFVCEDKEYSTFQKNVPSPLFRKTVTVDAIPEHCQIAIGTTGFYDLFINGKKITKGYLAPYVANHNHYVYFDEYDLTEYVVKGENVIGIMLGDGFTVGKTEIWDFVSNSTNQAPLLSVSLKIGEEEYEASDFECKKGPIIFNDMRTGVFYDARLIDENWCKSLGSDDGWHKPVLCAKPKGKCKICEAEPIKANKEIKPVSIIKGEVNPYKPNPQAVCETFETPVPKSGGYIYDFGENNSGIYRLKIIGKRGQKINIQCAEQLTNGKLDYNNINFYPDGYSQRVIYYLSGNKEEIFEPMFTFHGFRYIYIEGITEEQATDDLLTYIALGSALENRGSFECSDDVANRIYQNGRRSDISNFYYFPLDCPQREKNGWTGDASLSAEHMIMTIGAENSYREWLHNLRAAQTQDGNLPGICPTCTWGYGFGPAWDNALFELPYMVYKYRGETEIIKENAPAFIKYLKYISNLRNEEGIVDLGLGDWVPVGKAPDDFDASRGFTSSVYVYHICRISSEMFDTISCSDEKAYAEALGREILEAIRKKYIDFSTYTVDKGCQTSQAMAIYYDIFDEDEKQKAFEVLMDILKEDSFNITSGCLGLRVIYNVLSDFGQAETAFEMITRSEFPSYGYWIDKGETTMLENFCEYDDFYGSSKNHHFLGDVVGWFMRVPGGINVIDSEKIIISPKFIKKLSYCRASHILPSGKVEVSWERKNGKINLKVTYPEAVSCEIIAQGDEEIVL